MQQRVRQIESLNAWLRERGARFSKVEVVCRGEDYATIVAREAIEKDAVFIELPWECVLTSEVARNGSWASSAEACGIDLSEHALFALYLLEHRNHATSRWRTYVDALPQSYDTMPIFYDAEQLAFLQGSYALDAVLGRNRQYRNEYRRIRQALVDASFSLHDYRWARTAVHARCFRLRVGEKVQRAMLPLIDFVNHQSSGSAAWGVREETGSVACWARRPIAQGEEIEFSYGVRPLSRHFVAYGFLNAERRHDDARIALQLDPVDPLLAAKRELLPAAGRRHYFIGQHFDSTFREVLAVARLIHVADLDPQACAAIQAGQPVSIENEQAALAEILRACRRALDAFPTTVEQDRVLLERLFGAEEESVRRAVEFCLREKEVLIGCIAFVDSALRVLQLEADARRHQVAAFAQNSALKAYFAMTDLSS